MTSFPIELLLVVRFSHWPHRWQCLVRKWFLYAVHTECIRTVQILRTLGANTRRWQYSASIDMYENFAQFASNQNKNAERKKTRKNGLVRSNHTATE